MREGSREASGGVRVDAKRVSVSEGISDARVLKRLCACPRKRSEKLSLSVALAALRLASEFAMTLEAERFSVLPETAVLMILSSSVCVPRY
jgi:hypothetical protein